MCMIDGIISKNGVIIPATEAVMGIDHLELTHGFGVHETLRCVDGVLYFAEDHAARLCTSACIIGLEHPFREEGIASWFKSFVEQVGQPRFMLKVRLVGAARKEDAQLFIYAVNLPSIDEETYRVGVSLITREGERIYPNAKTFCMLQGYIFYREAKAEGAYDGLFVNRRGEVTEGTRTNFFALKDGVIHSAPAQDILLGITRKHVLETAATIGMRVEEAPIKVDALNSYDGFFITSTSINILPVTRIDHVVKPVPETIVKLRRAYGDYLSKRAKSSKKDASDVR